MNHGSFFQIIPHFFCRLSSPFYAGFRENKRKLLAADPAKEISFPQPGCLKNPAEVS